MTAETLAGVFKGGRISGWVERNRQALEAGNCVPEEIQRLEKLSPSFERDTGNFTLEQKAQVAREALSLADESPLSATRF